MHFLKRIAHRVGSLLIFCGSVALIVAGFLLINATLIEPILIMIGLFQTTLGVISLPVVVAIYLAGFGSLPLTSWGWGSLSDPAPEWTQGPPFFLGNGIADAVTKWIGKKMDSIPKTTTVRNGARIFVILLFLVFPLACLLRSLNTDGEKWLEFLKALGSWAGIAITGAVFLALGFALQKVDPGR